MRRKARKRITNTNIILKFKKGVQVSAKVECCTRRKIKNHSLSLALINLYLFLCQHLLTNSVRLLNRASSLAVKIAYFSARQRLHTLPLCW